MLEVKWPIHSLAVDLFVARSEIQKCNAIRRVFHV
jgi:hypothetical protein